MKKIIIIGMVFAILCACVGCGVNNDSIVSDRLEEVVDYTLNYIAETYGEECTSVAYDLNEAMCADLQEHFDEDLSECEAVVFVYDNQGVAVDMIAVNY